MPKRLNVKNIKWWVRLVRQNVKPYTEDLVKGIGSERFKSLRCTLLVWKISTRICHTKYRNDCSVVTKNKQIKTKINKQKYITVLHYLDCFLF